MFFSLVCNNYSTSAMYRESLYKHMCIDIKNLYGATLAGLWIHQQNIDPFDKGFAIEKSVAKDSLLFLSMNPSFKDGAWNNGTPSGTNAFYDIPSLNASESNTNSFFQAINKFYDELGQGSIIKIPPLAHHDLLFVRETSQETVLKLRNSNKQFFGDQLSISKAIIEASEPKIIIVINAGARKLFEDLFKDSQCSSPFDESLGAYMYDIGNKETKTPVLFSGMLSGQRALDLGSRESLKWHIRHILRCYLTNQPIPSFP